MKSSIRMLLAAVFISTGAYATKVPIPIEGASLNILVQVQAQALVQPGQHTDGLNPSFDVFIRRTRLLATGDISPKRRLLDPDRQRQLRQVRQLRGPARHRAGRLDRLVAHGLSPAGNDVVHRRGNPPRAYLAPHAAEHHQLHHCRRDDRRLPLPGKPHPGLPRQPRADPRWVLDKKIGFRGGVFEGYQPIDVQGGVACVAGTANTAPTPSACRRCAD